MESKRTARLHFDLTTVRLFIATAEEGGVTRAAGRMHLASAAASRRIVELEAQLGLPLFERRPHGMTLTEAGRAMLAHARVISHTVVRMQGDAVSYLGGDQGVVRLAAPKSAVIQFVPTDIERCTAAHPRISIDLQEMNSLLVHQALVRGVADIGIYEGSLGSVDLPTLPYRNDVLVVITPRAHPLASRRSVTLDDILSYEVITLGEGSAIALRLERLATESGRSSRMRMRVGGFDSIAALVAQGLGIGVMPQQVARVVAVGARFARIAIEGTWAKRQFVMAHRPHEQLSKAAQSVVEVFANRES